MKRPVLLASAALLLALAAGPRAATADCPHVPPPPGDPSPPSADVPAGINLVGLSGGVPDVRGEFTVTIRDLANDPVEGCEISIDFRDCWGIQIAEDQPWPGVTLTCEAVPEHPWPFATIKGVSDGTGSVTFRIAGGSVNVGSNTPGNAWGCAKVYAGTVLLRQINVGAFDQNSGGGANPADISVWLSDSFDPDFEGRSDYNGTNSINPADLAMLIGVVLGGGSSQSSGSYCN